MKKSSVNVEIILLWIFVRSTYLANIRKTSKAYFRYYIGILHSPEVFCRDLTLTLLTIYVLKVVRDFLALQYQCKLNIEREYFFFYLPYTPNIYISNFAILNEPSDLYRFDRPAGISSIDVTAANGGAITAFQFNWHVFDD